MPNETKIEIGGGGLTFCGLFFLVLFVMKIMGFIDWSWWLITLPLWGGLALYFIIVLIIIIAYILSSKW